MANKKKAIVIKLESLSSKYFYTTKKNPKMEGGYNKTCKLKLKKYDPTTFKHEWFVEKKLK